MTGAAVESHQSKYLESTRMEELAGTVDCALETTSLKWMADRCTRCVPMYFRSVIVE